MEGDILIEKSIDLMEKYVAKKETLVLADKAFMSVLEKYLSQRPELKQKYEDKVNQSIEKIYKQEKKDVVETAVENEEVVEEEPLEQKTEKPKESTVKEEKVEIDQPIHIQENKDVKRIYRDIVKVTHPDKLIKKGYTETQTKKMIDYYQTATKAYENRELLPLVRIAAILYLPLNLSEESLNELEEKIFSLQKELAYIETTFAWMWYHAPNQNVKDQMLQMFLTNMINRKI